MKPAREPASSRPKPCASLKKPHEFCTFAAPCGPSCRNKQDRASDIGFSLRNLPVQACDSHAQGFSPPLARRRSSCPPPSPNLVRIHPTERYQALRDSAPASLVPPPSRRAPNWGSEEARTWEHHPQPTIPPPRLNRQAESRRQPVGSISCCLGSIPLLVFLRSLLRRMFFLPKAYFLWLSFVCFFFLLFF